MKKVVKMFLVLIFVLGIVGCFQEATTKDNNDDVEIEISKAPDILETEAKEIENEYGLEMTKSLELMRGLKRNGL